MTKPALFKFEKARELGLFSKLTQEQVDNINDIVQLCYMMDLMQTEQVAYILATAYHETAATMLPIAEWGSDKYLSKYDTGKLARELGNTPEADGDGIRLKGRGHVMITGHRNYARMTEIINKLLGLDIDLVKNPEIVLKNRLISIFIMIYGMKFGIFTGVSLDKYINSGKVDYPNARRTVNGTDKMAMIAGYAHKFAQCL